MADIDYTYLDALTQSDLLAKREALIAKGNGTAKELDDTDLGELCAVFNLLRRRSSGPPAAKSSKSKAPAPSLMSLLKK